MKTATIEHAYKPPMLGKHAFGEVLRHHFTPGGDGLCAGRYILVDRGPGHFDRYATWWENLEDGGRIWGHYHKTLTLAENDFAARIRSH